MPEPKAYADGIPVYCAHDAIVDLIKLLPHPNNPNKHNDAQIKMGARIIKGNGWRNPITVSKLSGFITKGHGRLLFAQALGVTSAPVDYQEYANEAEEWQDILADNRLAELAEPDLDLVKDILENTENIDALLTGYDLDELLKETGSVEIPVDDGFDENPDEIETDIQIGQIFQLGRHRLMCGDATNDLHINQLMGDDDADFLFTDPPYEFDVIKLLNIIQFIDIKHILMMVGFAQEIELLKSDALTPKFDMIYLRRHHVSPPRKIPDHPHFMHVSLIYFTRGDVKSNFDRRLARGAFSDAAFFPSVIEEEAHVDKREFGYGKDLSAICKIISGFDFKIMLDLFGGSGTFLMACEKMNKTCYCMELDPKSCQLIINRWEKATGEKAEKK